MHKTKLSAKGQIVLPKALRESRAWAAGTEFTVESTAQGVLLRPVTSFPVTQLEEIVGRFKTAGPARSIEEMHEGIEAEIRSRHDRGRY